MPYLEKDKTSQRSNSNKTKLPAPDDILKCHSKMNHRDMDIKGGYSSSQKFFEPEEKKKMSSEQINSLAPHRSPHI